MRAKKGLKFWFFVFFFFCFFFFLYNWVTNLIFYQHETLKWRERERGVAYFTTYYDLHSTLIFNHLADFIDD